METGENEPDTSSENSLPERGDLSVRSIKSLVSLAHESDPDAENGDYWEAVRALQNRLPDVFGSICELGGSPDEKDRALAATVLGQSYVKDKVIVGECAQKLAGMIAGESSCDVIVSIGLAFGHLHDQKAVAALVPLRTHPDGRVRHAIAFGLLWQEEAAAIQALVELSADVDRDVRNWATFGLGQIGLDTTEIREALVGRQSDNDDEVRGEALAGLARRCDRSALPGMIAELKRCVKERLFPTILVADAMEEIAKCPELANDIGWQSALRELESAFDSPPSNERLTA